MSESNDAEQDFEKLSKAITEAVMNSPKVRKIIEDIQKKTSICPQSFMVLVLKMQVLADALESEEETPAEKKKPKRSRKKSSKDSSQQIDGKRLTPNELAFEEYVNERFDPEDWLKKNGLIL